MGTLHAAHGTRTTCIRECVPGSITKYIAIFIKGLVFSATRMQQPPALYAHSRIALPLTHAETREAGLRPMEVSERESAPPGCLRKMEVPSCRVPAIKAKYITPPTATVHQKCAERKFLASFTSNCWFTAPGVDQEKGNETLLS